MSNTEEFPTYITDKEWLAPDDEFINLLEVTVGDLSKSLYEYAKTEPDLVAIAEGRLELAPNDLKEYELPQSGQKTLLDLYRRKTREDERFLVEAEIGSGGEGVVFKITDKKLSSTLAGKAVPIVSPQFNALQKEAETLRDLPEGLGPTFHRYIKEGGYEWLLMEHLGPPDWDRLQNLVGERQAYEDVLSVMKSLFNNAKRMENLGIRHGDLKPSNIFLSASKSEARIIDWSSAYTGSGILPKGYTPEYASPEKLGSSRMFGVDGEADNRDDLFALQVVSFCLIVGKHPFEFGNQVQKHYDLPSVDLRTFWKHFSRYMEETENVFGEVPIDETKKDYLKAFFIKAFHNDLGSRLQTAEETLEYISKIL